MIGGYEMFEFGADDHFCKNSELHSAVQRLILHFTAVSRHAGAISGGFPSKKVSASSKFLYNPDKFAHLSGVNFTPLGISFSFSVSSIAYSRYIRKFWAKALA